jgi:hypothetical protein
MKFRSIIFVMVLAAATAMLLLTGYSKLFPGPSLLEETGTEQRLAAALEGFSPGAEVHYKINTPQGEKASGTQTVGKDGTLEMPASNVCEDDMESLTYDLSIEEDGRDPVDLSFKLDTESGAVSMQGQGFEKFGPVSFENAGMESSSKADWAGNFRQGGMWNLSRPGIKNAMKLVLFDNNAGKEIGQDPRIVQVFTAPGGGGFTSKGVNAYSNLWCESLRFSIPTFSLSGGLQFKKKKVPSTCDREDDTGYILPASGCPDGHMRKTSHNIMENYVRALIMMTEEFSVVMMKQVEAIGKFLDAKQQLETQRLNEQQAAEAYKDYQPSDTMCRFGSFIKSVPRAEEKTAFNKQALNDILMATYTNVADMASATGYGMDVEGRLRQFRRVYCDPGDNNDGLAYMCEHDQDGDKTNSTKGEDVPDGMGAVDISYDPPPVGSEGGEARIIRSPRMNKDIDYSRTAGWPLTLDLDFSNGDQTYDEEDVVALARNLYWPRVFEAVPRQVLDSRLPGVDRSQKFVDLRNILAMQNVAHNSFIQIAAMKSRSEGLPSDEKKVPPPPATTPPAEVSGWNFMKSMLREFGLSDTDIHEFLGEYPSYYAQMEVLTKKMYQSPDFYTNLYDKPVNVDRIAVAMDALRIMQQRDQLESRMRQEMLNSIMLEQALARQYNKVNSVATTTVRY